MFAYFDFRVVQCTESNRNFSSLPLCQTIPSIRITRSSALTFYMRRERHDVLCGDTAPASAIIAGRHSQRCPRNLPLEGIGN